MESYQCLVIGISRYQFLPPLSHGEADAKAIYQFFIEEAKIPKQQVLLVSDTSAPFKGLSTYPNQDNLLNWLRVINQGMSSTRVSPLWVFFNGYVLNYQEEDYLMPIDGNPQAIANAGISVRSLLHIIQQHTIGPILLVLNLYGSGLITKVGQQSLALAKQKGIAMILSLRPPDAIITRRSQSIFTTALLEALHYYRREITLTKLAQYLGDRLPSLSFPRIGVVSPPIVISPSLVFSSQPLFAFTQRQEIKATRTETELLKQPISAINTTSRENRTPNLLQLPPTSVTTSVTAFQEEVTTAIRLTPPPSETNSFSQSPSSGFLIRMWQEKWFWLGGLFALLFLVLLIFLIRLILFTPASNPKISVTSSDVEFQQKLLNRATTYLKENQASSFNRAINEVRKIPLSSPVYPQAQEKITRWSQVILDIAQGRAKEGNFHDAIAAARLVPNHQEQVYTLAVEAVKEWQVKAKQQQVNQALIEGATALIKPFSASSYNQGITILRQIPENELGYREAQQLIDQWSQKIYLIANSRAAKGSYQQAIATAQLVPSGTSAYEMASQAIAKWKTRQRGKG